MKQRRTWTFGFAKSFHEYESRAAIISIYFKNVMCHLPGQTHWPIRMCAINEYQCYRRTTSCVSVAPCTRLHSLLESLFFHFVFVFFFLPNQFTYLMNVAVYWAHTSVKSERLCSIFRVCHHMKAFCFSTANKKQTQTVRIVAENLLFASRFSWTVCVFELWDKL